MATVAPIELAEALSPEWLSFALSEAFPGTVVQSVNIVETIVTMATKVRVELDFASAPEGTPHNFCLKGLFGDHIASMRRSGVMETEARFYDEVARHLTLRLPNCVYRKIAPDGPYSVLVMEDVQVLKGARFLTALSPYTAEQAASSLEQLAKLHAASWQGKLLDGLPWLTSRVEYFATTPPFPTAELQALMNGPRGDPLPAGMRDAARIEAALPVLMRRTAPQSHNLVHGDCHAGNVYETQEGPSLVDWQLLQRGYWALDLAYHIAAVLSVQAREQSERHLIRHYLDCLARNGVGAPSEAVAWEEYRAHLAYGYYLWCITRRVEPEITNEFVLRLGSAAAAHRTYELLGV